MIGDGSSAPTNADGSAPAPARTWTSQPDVVLLPCVPATPTSVRPTAASATTCCHASTGMPASRAAASSAWSGSMAVSALVTARRSGRRCARHVGSGMFRGDLDPECVEGRACTASARRGRSRSRSRRRAAARSAAALAPAPAAPTTWIRSPSRMGRARRTGWSPAPTRSDAEVTWRPGATDPTRAGSSSRPPPELDPLEEELESRGGAAPLVLGSIAGPGVTPDDRAGAVGDGDIGQPDRLGRRSPVRPGDPGHRHREIRPGPFPAAARHRERDLRRDRAVRGEDLIRHADRLALELIRVRHEASDEVGTRARDLGDQVSDQAAGARFDGRDAQAESAAARPEADGEVGQLGERVRRPRLSDAGSFRAPWAGRTARSRARPTFRATPATSR